VSGLEYVWMPRSNALGLFKVNEYLKAPRFCLIDIWTNPDIYIYIQYTNPPRIKGQNWSPNHNQDSGTK